jgi:hypothetical protein
MSTTASDMAELEQISKTPACTACTWVTAEWATEHFGSESEGKFVALASPEMINHLFKLLRSADLI